MGWILRPNWHGGNRRTAQSHVGMTCDDPDAPGRFTHWVLINMPADVAELAEGVPAFDEVENGAIQGVVDFGRIGYGGHVPREDLHIATTSTFMHSTPCWIWLGELRSRSCLRRWKVTF